MTIDKKFIDQFIKVSSKAALASSYLVGKKDKIAADQAAVDSMRTELNKISMNGKVVIGEGSLDEAPMLYTGELLGNKEGPNFDIAVDPVEGTNFAANNLPGAIAVIAVAEKGNLFNAAILRLLIKSSLAFFSASAFFSPSTTSCSES